ncbi:arsenate reductase (glutaredoxin) [Oceanicola sp. D3]|uniref:arsenate reductase (glutaredoxin) n=1 Tax=Oceanicola sp. D3 TaxID=2587163 RepID=UPI001124B902|nr:arsenate reductase (glutaredoxin) [Oceanicola sp. D3]QDC08413.1 arsenate reductase (glutaredoxin) [Oceanicola sp. D3]
MSNPVMWHNPRCSKSRETLKLLEEKGYTPEVRLYLDNPPDPEELERAAAELGLGPMEMIRRKEAPAEGLSDDMAPGMLFAAMAADPILIERPVVFYKGRAAIGRPPENVLSILD